MNEKYKNLFEDLGKPTLRGVRKCPRCGAFNGTRGISCKNKSCNLIFKESKKKKKSPRSLGAVKVLTEPDAQIYSVKIRDRGQPGSLDYRGFVQLALIEGLDPLTERSAEIESLLQLASQCYIESCPNSKQEFSETVACAKQGFPEAVLQTDACKHIHAAIATTAKAEPLVLKKEVLDSMSISEEHKKEICDLTSENSCSIVQRASKNVMVVKCQQSEEKHPLKFVHVYFFNVNPPVEGLAICDCEMDEVLKGGSDKQNQTCIHYHACICAFLSDTKLKEEFRVFINSKRTLSGSIDNSSVLRVLTGTQSNEEEEDDEDEREINFTVSKQIDSSSQDALIDDDPIQKKLLKEDISVFSKPRPPLKRSFSMIKKTGSVMIDEDLASISFMSWLGSATERINQTMHYQFSGKPEPLVFHIPQIFFDCFQQRISASSMKKRLPNSTTTFVRKDALPLGIFTKYTWHINSILHVKQIFDNPEIPLQVTRSFVENRDGTYDHYEPFKNGGKELTERYKKTINKPLIKPLELQTFLKVGKISTDSKQTCPFVVEWIPNILPQSTIGELRISFEYGHLRNGQVEPAPCQRNQPKTSSAR